jgi:hypothetical protein
MSEARRKVRDGHGNFGFLEPDGSITVVDNPGKLGFAWKQAQELVAGGAEIAGKVSGFDGLEDWANKRAYEIDEEYGDASELYPFDSFVGEALPGVATMPITGGTSMWGQLATSAAIGAAESALDIGEGGHPAQRAVAGAAGGLLGEGGGRVLGRIWNSAKGLFNDIKLGRDVAVNPKARDAEDMGFELLESQRMAPNSQEQRVMQRLEQGAESSMFSPGLQASARETNQGVIRERVLDAIGLDPVDFDAMGPEALKAADTRLSEGFTEIASEAAGTGPITLGDDLASAIKNTRGQISDLMKRGRFQGLEDNIISGQEWNIARRALAQDAANAAGKGQYEMADELYADVEALDQIMDERIGPDLRNQFSRLREQYRVLKIVNKSGVINENGEIAMKSLNRRLREGTGFGDTAKMDRGTFNGETQELLDAARLGASPEFQPFRSSGTAENLSAQRVAGMAFDPTQWLSLAGEVAAPAATGVASKRGGRAVTGALTPSPVPFKDAGAAVGRSMLDESLYPFVGIEDERQLQ